MQNSPKVSIIIPVNITDYIIKLHIAIGKWFRL